MMNLISKIGNYLRALFNQGLSPRDLALSMVIAMSISLIPILGVTTILLTAVAIPMRLNLPIMIAVSYSLTPIQIVMVIPFINIGASIVGVEHTLLSFSAIQDSFSNSVWLTLKDLSLELICGLMGWLLVMLPFAVVMFYLLKFVFTQLHNYKVSKPIENN